MHICFCQYTSSQFGTSGGGREKQRKLQDTSHIHVFFYKKPVYKKLEAEAP